MNNEAFQSRLHMHSSNDARTLSNPLPPRTPGVFRIHSWQLPSPSPRSARPRMQHQDMNSAYGLDAGAMNPSNFERVQRAKYHLQRFANEIDAIMANCDNDDDTLSWPKSSSSFFECWPNLDQQKKLSPRKEYPGDQGTIDLLLFWARSLVDLFFTYTSSKMQENPEAKNIILYVYLCWARK